MYAVLPESTWSHIAPSSPVLQLFLPRLHFDSKSKKWSKKWPGRSFLTGFCSSVSCLEHSPLPPRPGLSSRVRWRVSLVKVQGLRGGSPGLDWWCDDEEASVWGPGAAPKSKTGRGKECIWIYLSWRGAEPENDWGGNRNKHQVLFLFTSNNLAVWGDTLYISHCTHPLMTVQAADAHSN